LNNGDRREGVRESNGRVELGKVKYTHSMDMRNPFEQLSLELIMKDRTVR
jgi:hypothetical protein